MLFFEDFQFKLYRFVPAIKKLAVDITYYPPFDIDFKTGLTQRLYKRSVINRGERILTQYYENFDPGTGVFDNLVVEVRHTYIRGGNPADPRLATMRTSEVHWTLEDSSGSFSSQFKPINKVFSTLQDQLEESQTRRKNAANELANLVVASFGPLNSSTDTQTILAWQLSNRSLIDSWVEFGDASTLIPLVPTTPPWQELLTNGVAVRDQFIDYFQNI